LPTTHVSTDSKQLSAQPKSFISNTYKKTREEVLLWSTSRRGPGGLKPVI